MTAFNIVRFRVKPGRESEFIDRFKKADHKFAGMRSVSMVKTGEGSYCAVGEWDAFDNIAAARPSMIGILDSFRHCLEELAGGIGVTDPVSGTAIFELIGSGKAKRAKTVTKKRTAQKPSKKPTKNKLAKRGKRR